ncbi:MAG: hypothetical protein M3Z37_07170 [Candidatus Eremiobacteraeota bacterium]|nr:hypothetical protein [Candidatus Eremiobacteraeota bacterium]
MSLVRELDKRRLRCQSVKTVLLAAFLVLSPALARASITTVEKGVPYLPVIKGSAVILNSGSTNFRGYRIVLRPDGSAEYAAADQRARADIAPTLTQRFFVDLRSAAPLHALPYARCMKSVSFGTSVFLYWNHSRSPDLSCPTNAAGQRLFEDSNAIAAALHLNNAARAPVMRPMLPGEQHKALTPTPAPSP